MYVHSTMYVAVLCEAVMCEPALYVFPPTKYIRTYLCCSSVHMYVCWKLQLPCGHSCSLTCHPGACADVCRRRVTLRCPCKRLKKVSILSDFLTLPCIQSSLVYIHMYVCSSWFICHVFVLRPCHPFYVFPFAISVPNVGSKML